MPATNTIRNFEQRMQEQYTGAAATGTDLAKTLGMMPRDGFETNAALNARKKSLVAAFGEAAFDKAARKVRILEMQKKFAGLMLDPTKFTGEITYSGVNNGYQKKYLLHLREIFPSLKPQERQKVKQTLENLGFVFEEQKIVAFQRKTAPSALIP